MLGVYTLLEAGEQGWGSTQTLGLGATALALLAAFVARQARIANPLMPLRLFRSRNVVGANVVMGLLVVGFFGMFFLGALYLQGILGYTALEVGLAFLPVVHRHGNAVPRLRREADHGRRPAPHAHRRPDLGRRRARALLARPGRRRAGSRDVLPVMLLLGLGAGLAFPALMTLAMSGATQSDAGLASGLVNTTVQVGGAIGLAVLATLATERTDALLADGVSNATALNSGYHLAYLIGAALIGLAVVAAIAILRPEPAAGEDEQRERDAMGREPAYSEGS